MSERWTLLTSHGHVLFYLAAEPDATIRQITDAIGLSERRVVAVLHDLEAAGMVRSTKVGNRKHYEVNPDAKFRHPTLSHVALRDVLGQLRVRASGPPPLRWRR
ncbi:MAG TPA: helix-turn-helix domain-containing protein [Chloroflexota bacterium]|nr:helix-turn-helix domain-containing protein [Chloroflexota bacterium]